MSSEKKHRKILTVLLFLLFCFFGLVVYLLLPARNTFTIGEETTYITGPLDSDGQIDYVSALNERLRGEIKPDQNANVLIWQAIGPHPEGGNMPAEYFEWLGKPAPPEDGEYMIDLMKFVRSRTPNLVDGQRPDISREMEIVDYCRKWPWTSKKEPEVAEWVKVNKTPLEMFSKASKLTAYYNPLIPNTPEKEKRGMLIGCLLPNVQVCRNAAMLFTCRAMLHLGENRPAEAWEDLMSCHRLGLVMDHGGTFIEQLVGVAIQSIAMHAELVFFDQAKLTKEMLDRCKSDLEQLPAGSKSADKIDISERFTTLDVIQHTARGGPDAFKTLGWGQGNNNFEAMGKLFNRSTDWNPTMRYVNSWYDRVVPILRVEDYLSRTEQLQEFEEELKAIGNEVKDSSWTAPMLSAKQRGELFGKVFVALMFPAIGKIQEAEARTTAMFSLNKLAIALANYRLEHGKYPATLTELAPKYLDRIPNDLFNGQPLKYSLKDDGYRLHSVGPNKTDDNGRGRESNPRGDDIVVEMPMKAPQKPELPKLSPIQEAP